MGFGQTSIIKLSALLALEKTKKKKKKKKL
jgi:hypothetical protein